MGDFDILYQHRSALKSRILVDFIVELTNGKPLELPEVQEDDAWILFVDGSSNARGCGLGLVVISLEKDVLERSIRLGFKASNNDVEYEALVNGLKMAIELGIPKLKVCLDLQLCNK